MAVTAASFGSSAIAFAQDAVGSAPEAATSAVTASANCTVNGQAVPCDQATAALGSMFGAFAGIFIVFIVIALVLGIFTLWMFIDCLRHDFKESSQKIMWSLGMVFFNFPAALVYYFVVKRPAAKAAAGVSAPVVVNVPPTPPQA